MAEHNDTGNIGEKLAVDFLSQNGYQIIEKNWRFGKEEIDIIAQKKDTLIVVEVKTRSGSFFKEPEEFVNRQKQKNIIKAANNYIEKNKLDVEVRFDIIGVIISGKSHHINHLEDAFNPIA